MWCDKYKDGSIAIWIGLKSHGQGLGVTGEGHGGSGNTLGS